LREALARVLLTLTVAWVLLLAGGFAAAVAGHGASGVSSALDNGMVRVGIDLNAGGSISYLSPSGSSYNLVNIREIGRYVGQSYYAGHDLDRTSEGQKVRWSPWPWNPVQGGDSYGNPATVLAWSNDGRTIYVKTRPLLWDMNREACQCDFETWITLEGRRVRVRNKLTTFRTDTRWDVMTRNQELPAAYAIADLHRVLTYTRRKPFTGDWLTWIPDTPSFWERWEATEHWAACVNEQDFGFGVYNPPRTTFIGGLYGSPGGREWDNSTCYLSPLDWAALGKTSIYSYRYFLIVGTLAQIRQDVYDLDRRLSETWGFDVDGDFEGWTPSATVEPRSVVSGSLEGTATNNDPYVLSPVMRKSASLLKKVVVRLRNDTSSTSARLFFKTNGDWSRAKSKTVTIQPHSNFWEYTFDMSSVPQWTGTITKLRFDPVEATGRFGIDWIGITGAG
jgi:hypothetical protein